MELNNRNWGIKYLMEWVFSLVVFILILPLLIFLIVMQQILDPGPVFYSTKRLGRNGTLFTLLKFRSMKVGSREIRSDDNKLIVLDKDPRITGFGRFLRLGFDELPQLLNILKGDMCIVGPRPDIIEELDNYNVRERKRLSVLPGITGLTQVLDGRSLSNKDNYELDVRYVEKSSFGTDLKILMLTLPYSLGYKSIGRYFLGKYMYNIDLDFELKEVE